MRKSERRPSACQVDGRRFAKKKLGALKKLIGKLGRTWRQQSWGVDDRDEKLSTDRLGRCTLFWHPKQVFPFHPPPPPNYIWPVRFQAGKK